MIFGERYASERNEYVSHTNPYNCETLALKYTPEPRIEHNEDTRLSRGAGQARGRRGGNLSPRAGGQASAS